MTIVTYFLPDEILKKPYTRRVIEDSDGSFFAEIVEFPGCFATGDSAAEARANLEEVAVDWLTATIELGQDIPGPPAEETAAQKPHGART